MKFFARLVFLALFGSSAFGQSSPAFDPNIYLPQIGDPGKFDTVHSSGSPASVYNIGQAPGESYGRIIMAGLPNDPPFLTAIQTGHGFQLNKLNVIKDDHFVYPGYIVTRAHIHTASSWDLIVNDDGLYKIYWETTDNFYDTSLFTDLWIPGASNLANGSQENPYIAHLVTDSVNDVILQIFSGTLDGSYDTLFVGLYLGGNRLYQQGYLAYPDSLYLVDIGTKTKTVQYNIRDYRQGDWRGVGRDDAIGVRAGGAPDNTNSPWYYYRNDPPFSMAKFVNAMLYDTIFTPRENPGYAGAGSYGNDYLSIPALPKARWDKSQDFVYSVQRSDDLSGSIYIFRGGSDFGSHRLFLDSAAIMIPNPKHLDPTFAMSFWGQGIQSCGDMTGTGRPVIATGGSQLTDDYYFFYVLGDAADSLADIFYHDDYGGSQDTVTGDFDNREDLLMSSTHYSRLLLLHGSSRIPIHINPKLAVHPAESPKENTELQLSPNPCSQFTLVRVQATKDEPAILTIHNVLGDLVYQETTSISEGASEHRIDLPSLPDGAYILTVQSNSFYHTSRLNVIR